MKPWVDGQSIDREIAEAYPCEECGAAMTYRAEYERSEDDDRERPIYHAFAVCANPECGNEVEF